MTIAPERKAFIRPDGNEKVTGLGRYTADINLTGQLHAKFRYADHPHARIVGIDTSAAAALPGVFAVLTYEDVPDVLYGGMVQDRRLFANEKVRWEGDVVAAVAALTPLDRGCRQRRSSRWNTKPWNLFQTSWPTWTQPHHWSTRAGTPTRPMRASGGAATRLATRRSSRATPTPQWPRADVVISGRYVADSSQGAPIEPRAILAQWQGEKVTVWSSTQVPFAARSGIAQTLQISRVARAHHRPAARRRIRIEVRLPFRSAMSRRLPAPTRRPVKLVFSRQEEFFALDHRREGMVIELETGVTREGRLVARRGRLVLDKGAYCGEGGFFAQMAAMHACGPYLIENIDVESYLNYSNNQPSSSVRAPTAPQMCWALEQHMDELAAGDRTSIPSSCAVGR